MPQKMHFSRREINEAAVFENQLKEQLFVSKFKHAFCEKPKNNNIIPKRVVKEAVSMLNSGSNEDSFALKPLNLLQHPLSRARGSQKPIHNNIGRLCHAS